MKKIDTQEKEGFMECDGVRKRTVFHASTVSWVDPDKEAEEKPKLNMPPDSEMFNQAGEVEVEERV